MDEKLTELVLREADHIYGGIPGFLLCKKNGMLCPNAGIDKSNIPRVMRCYIHLGLLIRLTNLD